MIIDINCDMGESFGIYKIGNDDDIFPYISSTNIACGFHAGDPLTILHTIRKAKKYGVAIGAHPSLPDQIGFGRREMKIDSNQLYADLVYQISALKGIAESEGVRIQHVKPHGALYNMAIVDYGVAEAIVKAVYAIDGSLILYTLPHGALLQMAQNRGIPVAREFFIDRTYLDDGRLTPRSHPDAMIKDTAFAARRALKMITEKKVETLGGIALPIEAETLCIHGDEPNALEFAKEVHQLLKNEGIKVSSIVRE